MWRVGYSDSADDFISAEISVSISSTSVSLSSARFSTVTFASRSTTVAPTVVVSTSFTVMLADGLEGNVVSFEFLELNWLQHWLILLRKDSNRWLHFNNFLQTMFNLSNVRVVAKELIAATVGVGRFSFTIVVTSDWSGSTFLSAKIIESYSK